MPLRLSPRSVPGPAKVASPLGRDVFSSEPWHSSQLPRDAEPHPSETHQPRLPASLLPSCFRTKHGQPPSLHTLLWHLSPLRGDKLAWAGTSVTLLSTQHRAWPRLGRRNDMHSVSREEPTARLHSRAEPGRSALLAKNVQKASKVLGLCFHFRKEGRKGSPESVSFMTLEACEWSQQCNKRLLTCQRQTPAAAHQRKYRTANLFLILLIFKYFGHP